MTRQQNMIYLLKCWKEAHYCTSVSHTKRSEGIVIHSDVFGRGLDCVLKQCGWVITYTSRHLRSHEKIIPHDLKLIVVSFALNLEALFTG